VDRHRLALVVEDDDLKESTGSVGTDVEVTVALADNADGVSHRMFYVEISDAVLTRRQ